MDEWEAYARRALLGDFQHKKLRSRHPPEAVRETEIDPSHPAFPVFEMVRRRREKMLKLAEEARVARAKGATQS